MTGAADPAVDPAVDALGIVELGDVCARLRAVNLDLFAALGAWVTDTTEPATQRLFAEACHRHAWHAELWADRSPTIPPVDGDALVASHRSSRPDPTTPTTDRADTYLAALDTIASEVALVGERIDPRLDPGTRRVVDLVATDIADLTGRLRAVTT